MKTNTFTLLALLCFIFTAFGQEHVTYSLISPTKEYKTDIESLTNDGTKQLFNNKMLNLLFAKKIGTYFGGSNDLSLQKFYTSIDSDDTSIALGANFTNRNSDETEKLAWILSFGFKLKSSDKFAVVYGDNGDFQENNIGSTLKLTYIGNGIINFDQSKGIGINRKEAVIAHREKLYKKYDDNVLEFNIDSLETFTKTRNYDRIKNPNLSSVSSYLDGRTIKEYTKLAKDEIDYIETYNLYKFLWSHWYSIELFTPFGDNNYDVAPSVDSLLVNKKFYAFATTLTANTVIEYSNGRSIFLKGQLTVKNNNNVLVNDISKKAFGQFVSSPINNQVYFKKENDVYLTEYNQFFTTSVYVEPAFFFLDSPDIKLGFSPSVEFNIGTYSETNWKFGLPLSLKDKDGKSKVNFEVQWKEVNTLVSKEHLVGISASFLFGKFIK